MTYLNYINQFHRVRRHSAKRFTSNAADLYYHLLWVTNRLGWKNPFNESTAMLLAELGMTDKTLDNARKLLIEAGLLAYTPGKKGIASTYELLVIEENSTENFRSNGGRNGGESGGEKGDLHKTKIKNKNTASAATPSPSLSSEKSEKSKPAASPKKAAAQLAEIAALALPHPGPEFARLWAAFSTGPKQTKKPLTAHELMLSKLGKYPEGFAIVMLEAAIQGDWQGIENGGTADAFTKWQAEQARRPVPPFPTARPAASIQGDPAPNYEFVDELAAKEQAELDRQQAEWRTKYATPAYDPNALFGHAQTAEEGLAQARNTPEYQRFQAEEAAKAANQASAQPSDEADSP